jgi:hypothetical protein
MGILGLALGIAGIAAGSYVGLAVIGLILSIIAMLLAYFGVAGRTRPLVGGGGL